MQLPLVVIAFLVLAVLLAVGILVVVAVPRLKGPEVSQDREPADQRHSSRTGRWAASTPGGGTARPGGADAPRRGAAGERSVTGHRGSLPRLTAVLAASSASPTSEVTRGSRW